MTPEGQAMQDRDALARMIAERVVLGIEVEAGLIAAYIEERDAVHRIRAERQAQVDAETRGPLVSL